MDQPDYPEIRELIQTELQTMLPECKFKNCADAKYDKKYHTIEEYTLNPLTHADLTNNKPFTDNFLRLFDENIPRDKSSGDIKNYFSDIILNYLNKLDQTTGKGQLLKQSVWGNFPISKPTPSGPLTTPLLIPSRNSLYFLFLANLYCNHAEYIDKYPWLHGEQDKTGVDFLFMCDQENLTGTFAIDKHLYMELFGSCPEENKPSGYEILDGYFRLSNTAIRLTDGPANNQYDNPGQTMEDFLAEPSPFDDEDDDLTDINGSSMRYIAYRAAGANRAAAAAASRTTAKQTTYTAPIIKNKTAVKATANTVKTVPIKSTVRKTHCTHGLGCKSHLRFTANPSTTYIPDLEHQRKFTHQGGGRKTMKKKKTNKKRKTMKKKKTSKRRFLKR